MVYQVRGMAYADAAQVGASSAGGSPLDVQVLLRFCSSEAQTYSER